MLVLIIPETQQKNKDAKKHKKHEKKAFKHGGGWVVVYKSETIQNNLKYVFFSCSAR